MVNGTPGDGWLTGGAGPGPLRGGAGTGDPQGGGGNEVLRGGRGHAGVVLDLPGTDEIRLAGLAAPIGMGVSVLA
jgi:hypothetical protein